MFKTLVMLCGRVVSNNERDSESGSAPGGDGDAEIDVDGDINTEETKVSAADADIYKKTKASKAKQTAEPAAGKDPHKTNEGQGESEKQREEDGESDDKGDSSDSEFDPRDADQPLAGDDEYYFSPLDAVHDLYYVKSHLEGLCLHPHSCSHGSTASRLL